MYPPPAQAPRKRHIFRNGAFGCLGVIVLIVVIVVAVAIANSGGSGTSGSSTASSSKTTPAAAAPAAHVGTTVKDGKFQFVVTSISQQKSVGDTTDGLGDTAQGEYTILHVTVTNISDAPQNLNDSAQYVYDAHGRKYNADTSADIDLGGVNGGSSTWFQNINPGNTVKGQLAFDMPAGSSAAKAELHDSMFSGGATVALG